MSKKISKNCSMGICQKKLWDAGREKTTSLKLRCPLCGTFYSFEAIRWRVLADIPPE